MPIHGRSIFTACSYFIHDHIDRIVNVKVTSLNKRCDQNNEFICNDKFVFERLYKLNNNFSSLVYHSTSTTINSIKIKRSVMNHTFTCDGFHFIRLL